MNDILFYQAKLDYYSKKIGGNNEEDCDIGSKQFTEEKEVKCILLSNVYYFYNTGDPNIQEEDLKKIAELTGSALTLNKTQEQPTIIEYKFIAGEETIIKLLEGHTTPYRKKNQTTKPHSHKRYEIIHKGDLIATIWTGKTTGRLSHIDMNTATPTP